MKFMVDKVSFCPMMICFIFMLRANSGEIPAQESFRIDDHQYLEQGNDIFAYNAIQIPGNLKIFDNPVEEALKYHSPYPAANAETAPDDFISKYFVPYMLRPERFLPLRNLYEKYNLARIKPSNNFIIPPIIHQIWVGPNSRERFDRLRQTWIQNHPGWVYKLWTDEDVKKLKLINQKYYDQVTCYAEKADILRYELLYLFGGVYADIDSESIIPLDILNYSYEFYGGLEEDYSWGMLINGSLACIPGHPIIGKAIESIPNRIDNLKFKIPYSTGPTCLSNAMLNVLPTLQDRPIIALPTAYLYGRLQSPDWSRPANLKPYCFVAHANAHSWKKK